MSNAEQSHYEDMIREERWKQEDDATNEAARRNAKRQSGASFTEMLKDFFKLGKKDDEVGYMDVLHEKALDDPEQLLSLPREELENRVRDQIINLISLKYNIPREKLTDPEAIKVEEIIEKGYQESTLVMHFDGHTVEVGRCKCIVHRLPYSSYAEGVTLDNKTLEHGAEKAYYWRDLVRDVARLKVASRFYERVNNEVHSLQSRSRKGEPAKIREEARRNVNENARFARERADREAASAAADAVRADLLNLKKM